MKHLLALLLCACGAFAQNDRRVVELKHIDFKDLGTTLTNLVRADVDATRKLVVLNGTSESLAAAEAIIKKLDQPKKTVELTFYILTAGQTTNEAKMPSSLEAVVKQLRNSFSYADYQLLDTAFVRAREGSGFETAGILGHPHYRIHSNTPLLVTADDGKARIETENLFFRLAAGTNPNAEINAPLDVREGQRVVIGKSTSAAVGGAVFLVVTAEVVE